MSSKGVNKVILVGNLGKDPEVRYMPNGEAVAKFTIATSESWKDQRGQLQERTEWHQIVVYRRLAEIVGEYLKKGAKVYVEGKLKTSKWQDKESGQDRYKTEINCSEMQMLDGRAGSVPQQAAPQQQPSGYGQQQVVTQHNQKRPPPRPQPQQQQQAQPQYGQVPQQQSHEQQQQNTPRPQANLTPPQPHQQDMQKPLGDGWDDDIPF